jgi:sigma-B regulation protein RsbU (phosphoserine phosphatase)
VRAAARHGQDHQAVLEWLNEALRFSNRGRFCTALYGTLRPTTEAWELATAAGGHPLPVLARADGTLEVLGRAGTLLGVYDDPRFHVAITSLHVGDTVVLYTDGITDLPPPHGLDVDDVTAIVAAAASAPTAEEVADAIGAAVTDLLPLEERHDDIAVVVLRVGDAPA